ncbi:alpha-D-ribose 1-methylphosphonate 5-triphosphate diphosphatase [Desulfosporosinus acididurans]|uniref:Alpha-D-ribose 1-methylphosphonate 5-triphosphate diphosphatase n=1 Tax=Desulfosporosinus acididurans TaxID=476652 RepID=A0A0J1FT24_9FIRM|nr:phosphonate metabolism protein PhnM [Desulfosporosinus acididurans]KLU66619.1 alpha-D-ribose 1-methylphosphonate 5-triphosphate diphosphatase [Desulfosporosinus acididurans]
MFIITNAQIITEESILTGYDLLIKDDRIFKIVAQGEDALTEELQEDIQVIDGAGGYVAPGFIDIHSDYIETMAAPRPTCLMDFQMSLRETERQLVSHGITTMFHSLSLFKDTEYKRKPIRNPENVRKFIDLVAGTGTNHYLIRHKFHARFEIDNVNDVEELKEYIEEKKVQLVSFMDHSPGQGQYRDLEVYRNMVKSYNDLEDQVIDQIIDRHQRKEKVTIDGIRQIAELAREKGIAIASHDDDTVGKLDLVQSWGVTISEFPISLAIAQKAKKKGLFTMAGAPNILLGGSHSGNLSAAEAILANAIDILCSDYYPPGMLHAVFMLHETHKFGLVDAFKLVTLNPAKAVSLDQEIGSIREGKKADLLIIQMIEENYPVITAVIIDGKLKQTTSYSA